MAEQNNIRRVKRAVIKEEYVAITGDVSEAVLLNQMIYWSERVSDFDKFIVEEKQHMAECSKDVPSYPLLCGWIHKSAAELKDEVMSVDSLRTISRKIQNLVDKGFLLRRNNPKSGYDRKYQYRINFTSIIKALNEKGYSLEGYASNIYDDKPNSNTPNQQQTQTALSIGQNDKCIGHSDKCICHDDASICHSDASIGHSVQAIPETITKITLETTSPLPPATRNDANTDEEVEKEKSKKNDIPVLNANSEINSASLSAENIVSMFNKLCPSFLPIEILTAQRRKTINERISQFNGNEKMFKRLFINAESSSYLKGDNDINWSANFDWIIAEKNAALIIEGSYNRKNKASLLAAKSSEGGPSYDIDEYVRLQMALVDGQPLKN